MSESETISNSRDCSEEESRHFVPEQIDLPQSGTRLKHTATDFIVLLIPLVLIGIIGYYYQTLFENITYPIRPFLLYPAWITAPALLMVILIVGEIITIGVKQPRISYIIIKNLTFGGSQIARFLFKQSSALFVGLAIGIPLLASTKGFETAAIATLFYASVILLKEVLLDSTAVLRVGDENYNWRDDDGNYESTTRLIQNIGSDRASSVTITYRAYDKYGSPLMKPNKAKLPSEYLSLEVGENIPPEKIFAPIPTEVKSNSDTALIIHYKAEDGFGKSLLPARATTKVSAE